MTGFGGGCAHYVSAERTGIGVIASFDRTIDRVATVRREAPS